MKRLITDINVFEDELWDISDADIEFDPSAVSSEPYFEYDNKRISCSFTGHRNIPDKEKATLIPALKSAILYLISQGVREFHTGGAIGFDTLAASAVYDISRGRDDIKLILELPYEMQSKGWDEKNTRIYEFIKQKADEVNVHGENPNCREEAIKGLLRRNRILMDKSHYCICYLRTNTDKGGTRYTVNYAKLHDMHIINLAE